jgi:hypothetical protein
MISVSLCQTLQETDAHLLWRVRPYRSFVSVKSTCRRTIGSYWQNHEAQVSKSNPPSLPTASARHQNWLQRISLSLTQRPHRGAPHPLPGGKTRYGRTFRSASFRATFFGFFLVT